MFQPDFRTQKSLDVIDEIIEIIADETNVVRQSNAFCKWLAFQKNFWSYSWNNVLLIAYQAKQYGFTATKVAGATKWKEMGRKPTSDAWKERLWILAPVMRKIEDPITGKEKTILIGFTSAYVFDVSQTDGEELPKLDYRHVGDDNGLSVALENEYARRGIELVYLSPEEMTEEYGGTCNGVCMGEKVSILATLTGAEKAATLAHELAHSILHFGPDSQLDWDHSRSTAEIEAESTAACILGAWGLEFSASSLYLAGWGGDKEKVRFSMSRIASTSKSILTAILPKD